MGCPGTHAGQLEHRAHAQLVLRSTNTHVSASGTLTTSTYMYMSIHGSSVQYAGTRAPTLCHVMR